MASLFLPPPRSLTEARAWWRGPAGYREVLILAGPLVLSTGSLSIQQFIDRMFLAWYSPEALAAALPAGAFSYTFFALFIGTASYVNSFVAQYRGAGQPQRIGPAVWQSLFFSLLAGVAIFCVAPLGAPVFRWAGHAPAVREMEEIFFKIMCYGGVFVVYSSAISGFFTGLGRTWTVMWVNVMAMLVNIVLDYVWIFGHWGSASYGVAGAAWATVVASALGSIVLTVLFLMRANRREFGTQRARLDRVIFVRLMRFGLPSGLQFMLDVLSFSLFIFFVGRIGTMELAATNLALQINILAFMPMIGFGIAASTLVGKSLGENRPDLATRATWATFHLAVGYMSCMALTYFLFPAVFVMPFAAGASGEEFAPMRRMAVIILRFVAIYSVFDATNVVFAWALKGAGDTRFVMICSLTLGWLLMVLPTWWASRPGGGGVYMAWTALSAYVMVLGFFFVARFLKGGWIHLRVIEPHPVALPTHPLPESPTADVDLES